MENVLLTLAVGVLIIVAIHSFLRFLTSINTLQATLITLIAIFGLYSPLLVLDWPGVDIFAIQIAIYGITVYLLTILHHQSIQNKATLSNDVAGKKWHWGPFAIISFFVVVVTIDSIFITVAQKGSDSQLKWFFIPKPKSGGEATSYFPGIIEHDFHEKEDQYNEYQQRLTEQRQRGWKLKFGWLEQPAANKVASFQLLLKDKKEQPITKAVVKGSFQRGNTSKQDQVIELKEVGDGLYRGDIALKYPGRWELLLKIESPQGDYDLKATTNVSD